MKLAFFTAGLVALFASPASARADEPCPAGTEPKADGGCAPKMEISCPAGTFFEPGKGCVAKVVECPAGMIIEANKCVAKPAPPPPKPPPVEPKKTEEPPKPAGPPARFTVGVRLGFMLPLLNANRDANDGSPVRLSSQIYGVLPIGLEVGYRVVDALYLGAVGSFGPAFVRQGGDAYCVSSATACRGDHLRVALQARLYPLRGQTFDPWIGLAFGYERLSMRYEGLITTGGTGGVTTTYSGFEFFELSVGGDLAVLPELRVGPFLSFALGQFGNVDIEETPRVAGGSGSFAIQNRSPHGWLQLGVRGAFGLF